MHYVSTLCHLNLCLSYVTKPHDAPVARCTWILQNMQLCLKSGMRQNPVHRKIRKGMHDTKWHKFELSGFKNILTFLF